MGSFFAERIGKEKTTVFNFILSILNCYAERVVLQNVDCINQLYLVKYTCVFKCVSQIYLCIQMGPVKCPHALELVSKFRYSEPFRRT